jgi:hypothetical protein
MLARWEQLSRLFGVRPHTLAGCACSHLCLCRIIHLQTFKFTFTGQQAVAFLQQQGLVGNPEAAAELCQRMLTQGLFKSIYHRDVFLPDGEVYRFSSSFPDGSKQKGRCVWVLDQWGPNGP